MSKVIQFFANLAALVVLFVLFEFALIFWQLAHITDVSKYENVKKLRWLREDLIEHFPETIPATAQNPKLHYNGGFLQGGAVIELRLQMPAESIEEIYSTYIRQAKAIYKGVEELSRDADNLNMLPKWHFYTWPPQRNETRDTAPLLPQDFEIFLLSTKPSKSNPTDWNHGESAGISISKKRNEIIYWAEDW